MVVKDKEWHDARMEIEALAQYAIQGPSESFFAARDNLARELAALRSGAQRAGGAGVTKGYEDTQRVTWLEERRDGYANIDRITAVRGWFNGQPSLRAAIDAAMQGDI